MAEFGLGNYAQPEDVERTIHPKQPSYYSEKEKAGITKEMSDKLYNDQYSTTEDELVKDPDWTQASKDVYEVIEGTKWSGSDEDAAKKGLDMMSRFNFNLALGTLGYTAKMHNASDQQKLSFYYLMDIYDKKDISGAGVGRAFKEIGLDPTTYIGISTLGAAFVGKEAAGAAAKAGLKEMLKEGAKRYLANTVGVGATEAAIYSGADDYARQQAAIGAGVQENYDPTQTLEHAAAGAVVGGTLMKGGQVLGGAVKQAYKEGQKLMEQAAGGGLPPDIMNMGRVTELPKNPDGTYDMAAIAEMFKPKQEQTTKDIIQQETQSVGNIK